MNVNNKAKKRDLGSLNLPYSQSQLSKLAKTACIRHPARCLWYTSSSVTHWLKSSRKSSPMMNTRRSRICSQKIICCRLTLWVCSLPCRIKWCNSNSRWWECSSSNNSTSFQLALNPSSPTHKPSSPLRTNQVLPSLLKLKPIKHL